MGFFRNTYKTQKAGHGAERNLDVRASMSSGLHKMRRRQAVTARQTEAARIAGTGVTATASITAAAQTGQFINMAPALHLTLLVFPASGSPPYPAMVEEPVSPPYLSRAVAGSQVSVKVDANDRQLVWINWSA